MNLQQRTDQQERFIEYLRERYGFGPMPSHDLQALVAAIRDVHVPGRRAVDSDATLIGALAECFTIELSGKEVSSETGQAAFQTLVESFLTCLQQRIGAGMVVHDSDGQYRSGFFLIPRWFVEEEV